ncbi:MAG: hypothetical protein EOM06_00725 [Sphingobacteriia bacterium]|nr:hypothetical protein [Sphingobacteriia bacterium]
MKNIFSPTVIKNDYLRSFLMKFQCLSIFLLIFIFAGNPEAKTQTPEKKTETERLSLVYPSIAFQLPGGNMADRFGPSSAVGGGYIFKTKNNWLLNADFSYIFGNKINEDSLIQNLLTEDGFVISDEGQIADVSFFERGFYSTIRIGKIIPIFGSNHNSGLMINAGAGFLQHKIYIKVEENNTAALRNDYIKGYDRLTNGFSTTEFIGYMHMGKSRLANFFAGFEFVQAWTENRRSMNFDTMQRDRTQRLDLLFGLKAGWIIPFRKRMADDFFYY